MNHFVLVQDHLPHALCAHLSVHNFIHMYVHMMVRHWSSVLCVFLYDKNFIGQHQ